MAVLKVTPVAGLVVVTVGKPTTVNIADGPAPGAVLPAISEAVPDAIVMPRLPPPLMLFMVTVRVAPVPVTASVPVALPVAFKVILLVDSVAALKAASA